ncbi:hypothetical protein M409DRAFT_63929 [Zasmidium cellare ATCC 36951]|uniref:LCCL domain-containing protein n=1 Tax=Zasmidium cellare ATCC 36951 TaxID=1080233 RepID=A0A6A6CYL7_ZASCE|nr:uncharacterized protein M409DRAFT_63929 [Zasmidium cellare ATCC 36951]KAF2170899.1 hypothetical protein M409DRAFT_63929 [Zasmidium cellare ATCC 36951]
MYQRVYDGSDNADAPLTEFDGLSGRGAAGGGRATWQERVSERIPSRLKDAWSKTVEWVKGPNPPRIYKITPIFPNIQHAPIALLDRYAPKRRQRFWLLILLYASWLFVFSLMLWKSSFAAQIPGYGTPVRLSCSARYWNDGNGCGLNGDQCRPFTNATLAFRCPADCHKTLLQNPHAVGDQEVVYKPLVVGGPMEEDKTGFEEELVENAVYRGDSFVCASAVHSGFIKDVEGGCGVLSLTGEQADLKGSKRHGIESVGFDSYFPHTFGFLKGTRAQCQDLRWPTLVPSVFFTALLSLCTTDPGVHFWSLFVALFFHVALVSDPPANTTYYGLLSIAFGRFLPACFCAWVTYKYTVKRSLTNLTAQVEKTILWLGAAWVGSLNNYTFDRIPIQRLTPHDIKAQPGAVPALVTIILALIFIALGQAWSFRVEGRMPRYLAIYGLFVLTLLIMLIIPGLNLRIHHYILGLLLIPGTSFQNRPSLIYQGLLLGLFINGVARWGFASILETPASLLKGAQQNTIFPAVEVLNIGGVRNITFDMGSLPAYDAKNEVLYDGISVLVNDVERFRGYGDDGAYWDDNDGEGQRFEWTWNRHVPKRGQSEEDESVDVGEGTEEVGAERKRILPEYFRFGYMAGSRVGDYSKAGRWDEEGRWREMESGPSL